MRRGCDVDDFKTKARMDSLSVWFEELIEPLDDETLKLQMVSDFSANLQTMDDEKFEQLYRTHLGTATD